MTCCEIVLSSDYSAISYLIGRIFLLKLHKARIYAYMEKEVAEFRCGFYSECSRREASTLNPAGHNFCSVPAMIQLEIH